VSLETNDKTPDWWRVKYPDLNIPWVEFERYFIASEDAIDLVNKYMGCWRNPRYLYYVDHHGVMRHVIKCNVCGVMARCTKLYTIHNDELVAMPACRECWLGLWATYIRKLSNKLTELGVNLAKLSVSRGVLEDVLEVGLATCDNSGYAQLLNRKYNFKIKTQYIIV
jgi:hypothetical protein